jgi:hypothetical protein
VVSVVSEETNWMSWWAAAGGGATGSETGLAGFCGAQQLHFVQVVEGSQQEPAATLADAGSSVTVWVITRQSAMIHDAAGFICCLA